MPLLSVHDVTVDSIANIIVGQKQFENAFYISGYPGKPDEIIRIDECLADYVDIVRNC